ncbi:hypothetical protein N9E91_03180 [Alphaproteobacteria bacterium]|nr:hypothetical protein [Alphaproteobacteria bacterium]
MTKYDACIVGGGAAALGSLLALLQAKPDAMVVQIQPRSESGNNRTIEQNQLGKFTPQRTHLGVPASYIEKDDARVILSKSSGGLSDYWSASLFATQQEANAVSDSFFDSISQYITVVGGQGEFPSIFSDRLNSGLNFDYVDKFKEYFENTKNCRIGSNRTAFKHVQPLSLCKACGSCIHGCGDDRFFRPNNMISQLSNIKKFEQFEGLVATLEETSDGVKIRLVDGRSIESKVVFLAAGILGTPRIVAETLNTPAELTVFDNLMMVNFFASLKPTHKASLNKNFGFSELAGLYSNPPTQQDFNFFLISSIPQFAFEKNPILNFAFKSIYNIAHRHFFVVSLYGNRHQYKELKLKLNKSNYWDIEDVKTVGYVDFKSSKQNLVYALGKNTHFHLTSKLMRTSVHYAGAIDCLESHKHQASKVCDNVLVVDSSTRGEAFDSHPPTLSIILDAWTKTLDYLNDGRF